jgi:hypothetical protein
MSELIDRQALIKQLKDENIPFNADINEIINIQPIAFDVANIVEKLEEYAKSKICDNHKYGCPYGDNDDIFCENCGALGAIKIVKQEINKEN